MYIAKNSPNQKYKPIKVLYWTSLTYQGCYINEPFVNGEGKYI